MGLMDDFLTELEADVRAAIVDIPAGDLGLQRGVRTPDKMNKEEFPHCFLTDPTEKTEELIYCQKRVEVSVLVIVWRLDEEHSDSLDDFTALQTHLNLPAESTLGVANLRGVQVELDQLWETPDKPYKAAVMRVTGRRVV